MPQEFVTQGLWSLLKEECKKLFPDDIFNTWFDPLVCLQESEETLVLAAPSEFSAIWLQEHYLDLISQKAQLAQGRPVKVIVQVLEREPREAGEQLERTDETARKESTAREVERSRSVLNAAQRKFALNPRNTFENFIVGPSNQFAHAASHAVANAPAQAYNPLFLYGETGLGKTHLMHAMAQHILKNDPSSKVVYVSCEKFTNEFISAIQENTLVQFRKFYRSIDVLLIDDIHFLAGKERSQEEFFHTFNELFESQRQICLSSDRSASEIGKLESRLVSRFQWGMATDIQPPDLETRVAILKKKTLALNYNIPSDILEFLAQRITRNVRRMVGALTRVASYSTLIKKPLDIEVVEKLLQDILQEEAQNQITVEKIQKKVVEYFDLRQSDMVSRRRPNNIAFPRQIAMYLSRILTNHSLKEIGESFGGRDHGTVIHACKTVENMMEQDESVRRNVDYLNKHLSNQNF